MLIFTLPPGPNSPVTAQSFADVPAGSNNVSRGWQVGEPETKFLRRKDVDKKWKINVQDKNLT